MIIGSVFLAILYGSGYDISSFTLGNFTNIPAWYWLEPFFSPPDLNQMTVMRSFGIQNIQMMGMSISLPDFLIAGFLLFAHFIWLIVPIILGYYFFKRRDI